MIVKWIVKLWNLLNAKNNIQTKMLWALVPSLLLAVMTTSGFDNYLDVRDNIFHKALSFCFFVIAFILYFFIFTYPIVRHFKTITDGLKSISAGNLNYRIPLPREDELGKVAQHINYMAERLQSQLKRERLLEQSKMELITSISHDLRTPLTSIIGYLNLLKTGRFDDEQEKERYIDNAFQKTEQLRKLIDDLFEYTRLSNGDVCLTRTNVNFASLVKQMINEFEPVAREQGLIIRHELFRNGLNAVAHMDIDPEMMVRAIDNLLLNALKFSVRPGEVVVKLDVKDTKAIFTVENMGEPIPKEAEKHLFNRFYKGDASRSEHNLSPGSGLGLSIARNIVELHGGRMWLEHREGHYKFCIELPLYKK